MLQQIIKKEQGAINTEIKQRKKLEKVRGKASSDPHSVVSFQCQIYPVQAGFSSCIINTHYTTNTSDSADDQYETNSRQTVWASIYRIYWCPQKSNLKGI